MRILALTLTAVLAGCSTEPFHIPDVAQIMNKSLPAALQPGATTPMPRIAPAADTTATLDMLAEKSIRNMFQDSYLDGELGGPGQGGLVSGYLNAQLSNIHSRLTGLSKFGNPSCTSNAPVTFTADLASAIDQTMTIALPDLQCSAAFQGDTHMNFADGAGEVFGGDGNGNYSLWVSAGSGTSFTATGGDATYANVQNEGSTDPAAPETVEGMLVAYEPQNDFGSALRFKANATASKFEMFYANNGGSITGIRTGDGEVWLGGGFRMISDQTLIYADGVIYNPDNPGAAWQPFTTCITASTLLTDPTTSDCDALATSFTLGTSPSLSYCEIVGAGSGCTIPVPMMIGNTPMASTVVSAIAAIFPISAAPAGVTSFY